MENNFENAKAFIKDKMPRHLYGGDARQQEIARCMIDYANVVLPQADVVWRSEQLLAFAKFIDKDLIDSVAPSEIVERFLSQ